MRGDFSRWSFDPFKDYARVLLQQGRPLLDSDWNEQVAILLHRTHLLARDLIGPFAGPADNCGFAIDEVKGAPLDFQISPGRYYVNGICAENHAVVNFRTQPLPVHNLSIEAGKSYLVYLDVWEDFATALEHAELLEPALGGIDTAARSRIVWQVRTHEVAPKVDRQHILDNWAAISEPWQPEQRGSLRARVMDVAAEQTPSPGLVSPSQRYRGLENQLYRIEIHHGGQPTGAPGGASFKWSRDNGSVLLPFRGMKDNVVTLGGLDGDGWSSLDPGDWLEPVLGPTNPTLQAAPLLQVRARGPDRNQVTLDAAAPITSLALDRQLTLRRWDHRAGRSNRGGGGLHEGAILIREGDGEANWIAIEDGLEIQFKPGAAHFRSGDFWIIPARTAGDGRILWPEHHDGTPHSSAPHGVHHHYAPLALVEFNPIAKLKQSCRSQFEGLPLTAA